MEPLIIEAGRASQQYWRDLWRYRELFGFLAWRDILVRYKQTVIGVAWAVIRPLLTIIIGAGIFGQTSLRWCPLRHHGLRRHSSLVLFQQCLE
jgi:lipopolysaccharide transport system permease protein